MSGQKTNITISFKSGEAVTVQPAKEDSKYQRAFSCEEISASFQKQGTSITLKGVVDGRVHYQGTLKPDTRSKVNLLGYLRDKLDIKKDQKQYQAIINLIDSELQTIREINEESAESISEIVEVFVSDFEWNRKKKQKNKIIEVTNAQQSLDTFAAKTNNILTNNALRASPRVLLFGSLQNSAKNKPNYQDISGFISVEIEEADKVITKDNLKNIPLSERIYFAERLYTAQPEYLTAHIVQKLGEVSDLLFFFHVYNKNTEADYQAEVTVHDDKITVSLPQSYNLLTGEYSYSLYAESVLSGEKLWATSYGDSFSLIATHIEQPLVRQNSLRQVKENSNSAIPLNTFEDFSKWCLKSMMQGNQLTPEQITNLDEVGKSKVCNYYEEALKRLKRRSSKRASALIRSIRNLGIKNIAMVTPEGPHAVAGGLSQVVSGLSYSLIRDGVSVTIISPLYDQELGSNHQSADSLIKNGIKLFGVNSEIKRIGEIKLSLGKLNILTEVLEARYQQGSANLRILFLKNKKIADRLYGGVSAKDQLRRSMFLARGALELLLDEDYKINSSFVLTNDWMSAPLEPLLLLDEKYKNSKLASTLTPIHVLHNAGAPYQGRFNRYEDGEDIWPILGLSNEHLGGFLEEQNIETINLTKATLFHAKNAILTVSKPYAEQLVSGSIAAASLDIDTGISQILATKKDKFYGISNGINQEVVRSAAFAEVSESKTINFTSENIALISSYKAKLKADIQKEFNLEVDPSRILCVMVGRLTEQKGISLFTPDRTTPDINKPEFGSSVSTISKILETYPKTQFIFAGPPSYGETCFREFEEHINYLMSKFPKSIATRFKFIPHDLAIKLTASADIFLMPSKYEPGGITQLEALACGTTVVAHRVGGLSATLKQFKKSSGSSFLFEEFTKESFLNSTELAIKTLLSQDDRQEIIKRAVSERHDWSSRVPYYLTLFQKVVGSLDSLKDFSPLLIENRAQLLSKVSIS